MIEDLPLQSLCKIIFTHINCNLPGIAFKTLFERIITKRRVVTGPTWTLGEHRGCILWPLRFLSVGASNSSIATPHLVRQEEPE